MREMGWIMEEDEGCGNRPQEANEGVEPGLRDATR
jgi:hypothetical protein